MLLARLFRNHVGRTYSLPLGIVIACLCGWSSVTPLYAHDVAEHGVAKHGVAEEVSIAGVGDTVGNTEVELPPHFVVRTVVSGLTLPTDMVILPSGDFLVTEKGVGSSEFSTAGETEFITERRYEFVAPTASKSYIAFYEYLRPARLTYLPVTSNQQAQDSAVGEVAGEKGE